MKRVYEILKSGLEPIVLSALYVIFNLNLNFMGGLPFKYFFMLVLLLLVLNVWTLSFVISFLSRRLSPPYGYFAAYIVWALSYLVVHKALKNVVFSYDYMLFFITMFVSGFLIVVFYAFFTKVKADITLLVAGAFAAYLYLLSLDYFFMFFILLVFLVITGVFLSAAYKLEKTDLKTVAVSFSAGSLLYVLGYFIVVLLFRSLSG